MFHIMVLKDTFLYVIRTCISVCDDLYRSGQYRYVTNPLYLYVNNYYICVCTVTLLLLGMCLNLARGICQ